jgi:DinB superfamily
MKLDETLSLLERTPATLRALLEGLPESWLDADEGPDTFSPRDVLGHLILGERTDWVPRLRIILQHGESRAFEPFDRFGFRKIVAGRSIGALLGELQNARAESLRCLRDAGLTPADLERRGRHPELGTVTLGQLLATWVVHDLGHLRQVARVLAKHHASAVGPWRAYLSILGE